MKFTQVTLHRPELFLGFSSRRAGTIEKEIRLAGEFSGQHRFFFGYG
jgi:hypothetical protein